MDARQGKVVEHAATFGVFSDLYSQGATPDQIKNLVVDTFAPYVENQQSLNKYAVDLLVADCISLKSISDSPYAMGLFREALRIHRTAVRVDRTAGLQTLAACNEDVAAGLATFWSAYHTQRNAESFELDEFAHECLRSIGTIIEGPMKAHLLTLACHSRISRGKPATVPDMRRLTLGQLVDELVRNSAQPELFRVEGVTLSQWRNIAQHFSVKIEAHDVVCEYGERRSEVRLARDTFRDVRNDVVSAFKALKVAHVVVFFDHLDEMQLKGLLTPASMRPEASLIVLISALASQGFEVVGTQFESAETKLVLRDLSMLDPAQRRFHSTQFVIPLFRVRPADKVTVDYLERDGTPSLRTTATRELLEEAEKADNWTVVAEKCLLTDLKTSTESA